MKYLINNPIFVKYKKRFDWLKMKWKPYLKSVYVNERIVEIPFAIRCLSNIPKGSRVLDLGCSESPFSLQAAGLRVFMGHQTRYVFT